MRTEFQKHEIPDLGQKLAYAEGILGAYLPSHVFNSKHQQNLVERDKTAFSKMCSGKLLAANWELGRFVDLFTLSRYGFDYQLFLMPFDAFVEALRAAGVGSHGISASAQLREALRDTVDPGSRIEILRKEQRLNIGGIGFVEEIGGPIRLTQRDAVALHIPLMPRLSEPSYMLVLHDFPDRLFMNCLMPSNFAPVSEVEGKTLRLPHTASGHDRFPVGGVSGYRCLYAIQSPVDLADYIGLPEEPELPAVLEGPQVTLLMDFLRNLSPQERKRTRVSFGEYLLQ